MPGKISFEKQGLGVVIIWTGCVSGDEIRKVNKNIYEQKLLHNLRYQIWDFTEADRADISNEDMREFAIQDKIAAETNPHQIVAIVGSEKLFRGHDRVFHIYEEIWSGFKSKTFSTMAAAREWVSNTIR